MNEDHDPMTDDRRPPPQANVTDLDHQIQDTLHFRTQVWGKVCHALACPLPPAEQRELMALHEGVVRELDALRGVKLELITNGRIQS